MSVLAALYERQSVLQAREQMRLAVAVALGSGTMAPKDHRTAWDDLQDRAGVLRPQPVSGRPSPLVLAAMGIQVAS